MTTNFSRGISTWRFFRLCWRAPLILITCAGILTRNVEPFSQAQRSSFLQQKELFQKTRPALHQVAVAFFARGCHRLILILLPNMFTNLNLTDRETGYKAFKAPLIKTIQIEEANLNALH